MHCMPHAELLLIFVRRRRRFFFLLLLLRMNADYHLQIESIEFTSKGRKNSFV